MRRNALRLLCYGAVSNLSSLFQAASQFLMYETHQKDLTSLLFDIPPLKREGACLPATWGNKVESHQATAPAALLNTTRTSTQLIASNKTRSATNPSDKNPGGYKVRQKKWNSVRGASVTIDCSDLLFQMCTVLQDLVVENWRQKITWQTKA